MIDKYQIIGRMEDTPIVRKSGKMGCSYPHPNTYKMQNKSNIKSQSKV